MFKKVNWFIVLILFLLVTVVGYRFYQYKILRNFLLEVNTVCNPEVEECFVMDCVEGELDCDTSPYKKVEILAHDAPVCLEEHMCESFSCPSYSNQCVVVYCSEETLLDGEICTKTTLPEITEPNATTSENI